MEDYRDSLANETRFKRFKGDFEDKKITLKNVDNTVWKPNYSGEKNHYLTGMKFEKGYLIIAVLKDNIKEEYSQKEGPFDITGVVTDIGRSAPILRQCIFTKIKKPKTPQ